MAETLLVVWIVWVWGTKKERNQTGAAGWVDGGESSGRVGVNDALGKSRELFGHVNLKMPMRL